ncbi:hypothetical protein Cs7R123_63600 [Catellatospora sp. TT07R-123]|uniref:FxSxx-COOH system tetratricopeptide repeat protein n=1 Tax=Catellatospora sp. TT07R-123 TaxID=2733863 RepID=UPI001B0D163D|nr:FxSxx-COOH system tetratricopeptide repeat protein [Catellatospora sp. TT07R-123]GHJ49018.1 hypothetical protein Cs7R123_63600 [Catellatospora sp. TT07R-123]
MVAILAVVAVLLFLVGADDRTQNVVQSITGVAALIATLATIRTSAPTAVLAPDTSPASAAPVASPLNDRPIQVWSTPPRNPHFTGRETELRALAVALSADRVVSVSALHGLGGVGKTHLALEFAYRHQDTLDTAWWVRAEEAATIPAQMAAFATALGVDAGDDPLAAVRAELGRRSGWLLVFDNVEDFAVLRDAIPTRGDGWVLITTRRTGAEAFGQVLSMDVLRRTESVRLLEDRLPELSATVADRLADLVGDLPLALVQAASYIRQTGIPVTEYVRLLESRLGDMVGRGYVVDRDGTTIATLWQVTLERLRAGTPAAVQLLEVCAWLDPDAIPLDLFTNHPNELPSPLSEAAADPVAFADAVGILVAFSLIRRDGTNIAVHRLLQASVRATTPAALTEAVALLDTAAPEKVYGRPRNWPSWRELLPHVLTATSYPEATTIDPDRMDRMLAGAGAFLQTQGQYSDAEPLLRRALSLTEATHGPDHPRVAIRLNNLAKAMRDLKRPGEAVPLAHRALAINEAIHGPDHPSVAIRLNSVAMALQDLGQSDEAEPLLRRALAINESVNGPDHSSVAIRLHNLARVLRDLERPGEAEPLARRALAISEAVHGPDHPTVAIRLHNLAQVLLDLERPSDAEPFARRALSIDEAAYGPNHPDVAIRLNGIARVLEALGRPSEAEPFARRAADIQPRLNLSTADGQE